MGQAGCAGLIKKHDFLNDISETRTGCGFRENMIREANRPCDEVAFKWPVCGHLESLIQDVIYFTRILPSYAKTWYNTIHVFLRKNMNQLLSLSFSSANSFSNIRIAASLLAIVEFIFAIVASLSEMVASLSAIKVTYLSSASV